MRRGYLTRVGIAAINALIALVVVLLGALLVVEYSSCEKQRDRKRCARRQNKQIAAPVISPVV